MATLVFRSTVSEFGPWKTFFDGKRDFRAGLGVQTEQVLRDADDANVVIVIFEFESVAAAKALVANPETRANMAAAGVVGPPTFWFAERIS